MFVALTPPPEVVGELWAAMAVLRANQPGLRWTTPEQWHLTLVFLGEVEDSARPELIERVGRVATRNPPLTLSFGAGGRFGNRVLWTRVEGETDRLRRLATSARAACRRCGLPVEDRPYRPHLTLARTRGDTEDLRTAVAQLDRFAGRPWTADRLHLVRSLLGAGPGHTARHERIISWPLGTG
ncbi:RNA 2',3'-cyclic phosphodiesterase [Pseudonocardia asaccharolytica DSM 44247 = NBRC 16224]|uniref:RNA 2',3'-cyclic phosphodiesterase n=1 Tax=Pseudonocardia asaccharolytica DSM 44247 = NBRC 16224 TaxID=1123024 RepID=A0A511D7P6_9PSEU|nr:RNA 2',3'-cyclic phosphodiesterase [Pseudonocardia asaccharolytica DSM 44247 = NBRC 16224]